MSNFAFDTMVSELTKLDTPLNTGPTPRWKKQTTGGLQRRVGLPPKTPPTKTPGLSCSGKSPARGRWGKTPIKSPAKNIVPQYNAGRRGKTPTKTPNKGGQLDRFIPNRVSSNRDLASYAVAKSEDDDNGAPGQQEFQKQLSEAMSVPDNVKILTYQENKPRPAEGHANNLQVLYSKKMSYGPGQCPQRHIPKLPERILDAPELLDDYYLNILDWSSNNHVCIALGSSVYIWDARSGAITQLMSIEEEGEYVSSVKWIEQGTILAVGTSQGHVELWDVVTEKRIRSMTGHVNRVGSLSWNAHIVSSGSRSGVIHHSDVRVANHNMGVLTGHAQDVCGLAWSPDGKYLASGGNDNILNVWSNELGSSVSPLWTLTHHQAAVKALSWCPWQANILASGGGTADRHIRTWNVLNGSNLQSVDAGSQVCAILWSKEYKELISGHGFSQNQLTIWKYPELTKTVDLEGHKARVLNLAMSPDHTMVASAAADETLRIWNCFALDKAKMKKVAKQGIQASEHVLLKASNIR